MTKADIAKEVVERYLTLSDKHKRSYSKKYIATVLYNENPYLFADVEHARLTVRGVLNAKGKTCKAHEELAMRFAFMESGYEETTAEDFIVPVGYKKTLVVSDIHSRFYDKKALETAINYSLKRGADSIIINGDFMDFYGYSRFDKSPLTMEQFYSEREWGADMLETLQSAFGYVILKQGNHDKRREDYFLRKAASAEEYRDIATYEDYLMFDGSNVQHVKDYQTIQCGKLNIIHGHEYQGGGGVHVAWNRLNKAMDNIMSGHSHVAQTRIKKSISGQIYGSWSIGCLCSLTPRYNPKNDWVHGFAYVERNSDGTFEVENKIIIDGSITST